MRFHWRLFVVQQAACRAFGTCKGKYPAFFECPELMVMPACCRQLVIGSVLRGRDPKFCLLTLCYNGFYSQ